MNFDAIILSNKLSWKECLVFEYQIPIIGIQTQALLTEVSNEKCLFWTSDEGRPEPFGISFHHGTNSVLEAVQLGRIAHYGCLEHPAMTLLYNFYSIDVISYTCNKKTSRFQKICMTVLNEFLTAQSSWYAKYLAEFGTINLSNFYSYTVICKGTLHYLIAVDPWISVGGCIILRINKRRTTQ